MARGALHLWRAVPLICEAEWTHARVLESLLTCTGDMRRAAIAVPPQKYIVMQMSIYRRVNKQQRAPAYDRILYT